VARWTSTHSAALRSPAAARALVVAYEHLVRSPDETYSRVTSHLARHHATWRHVTVDATTLSTPSATSFRRGAQDSAAEWIGTFADLPRGVVDETARLLDDAGLATLYGAEPEPLVAPQDVSAELLTR
jgi:hypothetical protein